MPLLSSSDAERLPQLRMKRADLTNLPLLPQRTDYSFRTYRRGDEQSWATIMNTGIGSGWTETLVQQRLTRQPQFDPDGLYFALRGLDCVGSACCWRDSLDETRIGLAHMVCVLPEHRGLGLGEHLTLLVLRRLRETGFAEAQLLTDDFRLSAIHAYLAPGFEPLITHPSHEHRWLDVRAALRARAETRERAASGG